MATNFCGGWLMVGTRDYIYIYYIPYSMYPKRKKKWKEILMGQGCDHTLDWTLDMVFNKYDKR